MTAPFMDPLAGYSPDWRRKLGTADDPLAGYTPGWQSGINPRGEGVNSAEDPLAGYTPNWRTETAQALFGGEAHQPIDPALLAGIQETAGAGVDETPFQNAYRRVGRVGKQLAASIPEQVTMGARDLAGTAAALGGPGGLAGLMADPRGALQRGQAVREQFTPALEQINELAGEPQGFVESAARMVGPVVPLAIGKGLLRGVAGRAAAKAAGLESDALLSRITEAPKIGDEVAAHRLDELLQEPRTPNAQAVTSFSDALAEAQARRAASEAATQARIEAPRTPNNQAVVDFQAQLGRAGQPAESPDAFIQRALSDPQFTGRQVLAPIVPRAAADVEQLTGIPMAGAHHEVLASDLRHILNEHGNPQIEAQRGQIPVTVEDLRLIPSIVQDYDAVVRAKPSREGWLTVRYEKRINGGIYYVEEVLEPSARGGGVARLRGKTMWKRPSRPGDAEAPPTTSEPVPLPTSPTPDNLAPPPGPGNELGGLNPRLLAPLAGAGAGAGVGAAADPENRLRGAALGAVGGGLAGAALGRPLNRRGAVPLKLEPPGSGQFRGAIEEALAARRTGLRLVGADDVNPDDYLNIEKFALDPTGEQRLRSEITKVVQEQGIHPKQVVSWEETRALANDIGLGDLPKEQLNTRLNGPQMLAIRNIVSTNVEALEGLYGKVKTAGLTPAEMAKVDQSIGYLERENDALLGRFTRNRTQTGRDLNNLKILANRVMDPFTWLTKAENLAQQAGKTLAPEQRARIVELVKSGDKGQLVKYIVGIRPVSRVGQAVSLWKTGLLTNPKTHIANLLGNTAMAGLETAKDLPAALVDRVLSLGTGLHAKSFSLLGTAKATWKGAKEGAQEAYAIARHGVPADLTRWDLPNEVTFKNPILNAYTQLVRRGLAAPDAFFKKVALHRALGEAERLGPITEEAALQAVADAEYATFQNNSRLARIGSRARKEAGVVGQIVAPFTQTPGNVVSATLDYSPFGAIRGGRDIYRLIKATKAQASPTELRALQKAASESIGRTVTGTSAAFLGGYILARNGEMTGARPSDPAEQEQWDLAGKQENAVRIGKHWLSLNRLSPLGNLMALGANYYLLRQNPEAGELGALGGALGSVGTTASEQSFLKGAQEIKKAIDDPIGQGGKYFKNLAASVVPSVVGAVARGIDPKIRDTRGGFLDAFQSRVPGLSQRLPAQPDQLGRDRVRSSSGVVGRIAEQLFDPTTAREYKLDDPVIRELEATGANLSEVNQGRARPAEVRKLEAAIRNTRAPHTRALLERRLDQAKAGESRETYLVRSKAEGKALNRVLRTVLVDRNYQRLPSEARKEVLEAVITKFRRDMGQLRRQAGR